MEFSGVTYRGPSVDDDELLALLPDLLRRLLRKTNGVIAFDGGMHIRGACHQPQWHSLRRAWRGEGAVHRLYASVEAADIPFAQDAVGDQWLLRDQRVVALHAETGELDDLDQDLDEFFAAVERDPVETLGLQPLMQYRADGQTLAPGELLSVYPPFCTEQAADGVDLRAVPALERLNFLADFARQLQADGSTGVD
jgi:hypothetical protein